MSATTPVSRRGQAPPKPFGNAPSDNTRLKANQVTAKINPTIDDIDKIGRDPIENINTAEKAAEYLHAQKWIEKPMPTDPNMDTLIYLMFYMAGNIKTPTLKDNVRALAFYASAIRLETLAKEVAEKTIAKIQPAIEALEEVCRTMKETELLNAGMASEVRDAVINLQEERAKIGPELVKAVEEATVATTINATQTGEQASERTYAAALRRNVPQNHDSIMAREEIRSRQVMVDGLANPQDGSQELSIQALLQKAQLALDNMEGKMGEPHKIAFVAAKRIRNGGVLFELTSTAAAQWLQIPDNLKAFSRGLGSTAEIKKRTFSVIAEFVPVAFQADKQSSWSEVETRNNLDMDEIAQGRWIKPVGKRYQGQRFAHLIINCSSPETANTAIRKGLIIAGKRVNVRKLISEPRRCLKCQRFDNPHLARDCRQTHERCGTCGNTEHKTAECKIDDPRDHHCVNCERKGHASWSRECPEFKARRERLLANTPDSSYIFYPTSDPKTWEQRNDTARREYEQGEIVETNHYRPWSLQDATYFNKPPDPQLKYNPGRWDAEDDDAWQEVNNRGRTSSKQSMRYQQTTLDAFGSRQQPQRQERDEDVGTGRFPSTQDYE